MNVKDLKFNSLTPAEETIIVNKGTEAPFSGKYCNFYKKGEYLCKRCNYLLYTSDSKFNSECGWPSFDASVPQAVMQQTDADGRRSEILCANCLAHLGHIFTGEGYTETNVRHCVNSLSLNFAEQEITNDIEPKSNSTNTAIFAGGCFWGMEYYFTKEPGVISTQVGYIGGNTNNPSYKSVCTENTGHAEAVRIIFDPSQTSYEKLANLFFEIHDPTQINRQGPDVGKQYRSEVFYLSDEQKAIVEKIISELEKKEYAVATKLTPATHFWPAEDYHQHYYANNGEMPYCHFRVKR